MTSTLVSKKTGTPLIKVGEKTTTPTTDSAAKVVKIDKRAVRLAQNEEYLKDKNVSAFIEMIAWAEGGGYDFKYGAIKGLKNDPWRFSDYSTHPGAGKGGKTTAAGMYQITIDTWKDHAVRAMGLTDFSPHTQDLIAVNLLRRVGVIDAVVNGDFQTAAAGASHPWASLAQGSGLPNRYPPQPYKAYEEMLAKYKELGGTAK